MANDPYFRFYYDKIKDPITYGIGIIAYPGTCNNAIVNTLRPRQNGRHFADDTSKYMVLNENVCISIEISLKFIPKGSMNKLPALVQIMAWRRTGDKPLSEPMMVSLLTHICVTRLQWVKRTKTVSRTSRYVVEIPSIRSHVCACHHVDLLFESTPYLLMVETGLITGCILYEIPNFQTLYSRLFINGNESNESVQNTLTVKSLI